MIVTTRRGAWSRRAIAAAASGSVGETTAPSTNAAATERPILWPTTPTAAVVTNTSPTARNVISRMFARSPRTEVKSAATCSSGGRKMCKTTSGSSRTSGSPGTNESASPPTTSRIGYGTSVKAREHHERGGAREQREQDDLELVAGHRRRWYPSGGSRDAGRRAHVRQRTQQHRV